MAWLAVLLIMVAFGGMALAFGWSERAEEGRILARAEAILARGTVAVEVPAPAAVGTEAIHAPSDPEPGAADAPRGAPGCGPDDRRAAAPDGRDPLPAPPVRRVRSVA